MDNNSIFIFTNNDSIKLSKILEELSEVQEFYNIHVIDDSHVDEVIKKNINITSKYGRHSYLGKEAFAKFYASNFLERKASGEFIGTENWNLGTARNFALDYSIIYNYEKVLFIDDDISDINSEKLEYGFKTLTNKNFVSCNLKGRTDDSIVGHLAKNLDIVDNEPRMLSGGFWFLSPHSINNRFYNIYNEDWILQLLESNKHRIILPFSVDHDIKEQSLLNEDAIFFQEIGEIVVIGLLNEKDALTMKSKFWNEIIRSRIFYLKRLIEKSQHLKKNNERIILSKLCEWLGQFKTETLLSLIKMDKNEQRKYFL